MKVIECRSCGQRKLESEFYASNHSQCKECVKRRVKDYRAQNIERVQEYDRKRGLLPHRKEGVKARAHRYTRPPKIWRSKNPEKYSAHVLVGNALRDGKITKPPKCERCSRDYGLHAHHDDYSKPLEVMWLCAPCHGERHRELNEMRRQKMREAAE
jgi:uncharacterized protein (DUF983 family)